jgi:hypothetical protein
LGARDESGNAEKIARGAEHKSWQFAFSAQSAVGIQASVKCFRAAKHERFAARTGAIGFEQNSRVSAQNTRQTSTSSVERAGG